MAALPKILVTGSNGQLGMELRNMAKKYPEYLFLFTTREEFSLSDPQKMSDYFDVHKPDYCINAAAFTDVDKAESSDAYDLLNEVNVLAPGTIAALCKKYNAKLIHISSDYVFDGKASTPYDEESSTNPISSYGRSKLMGEKNLLKNENSIIIRTSWVYSPYGKNFVKTMLRLMNERKEVNVVNDQLGSPTYAADLAEAILQIISFPAWQKGIYNYTNNGEISWFDFAEQIKEFSGSDCIVNAITTEQYPLPAKRPAYSVLDKKKIQQVFGIRLKNWQDSLADSMMHLR